MVITKGSVKIMGVLASPFVNRVQLACNLKLIEYEFIEENPHKKNELLLQSNPIFKKVPVFFHEGKTLSESLIIVQYIDEIWTQRPSILPSDPYDRARARFWAYYIDEKLFPLLVDLKNVRGDAEAHTVVLEKISEAFVVMEGAFKECSKGKPFFGGDTIGFVDIALGGMVGWLRVVQKISNVKFFDEAKTPSLVGWVESICSDKAAKDVILEPEKLMAMHPID